MQSWQVLQKFRALIDIREIQLFVKLTEEGQLAIVRLVRT